MFSSSWRRLLSRLLFRLLLRMTVSMMNVLSSLLFAGGAVAVPEMRAALPENFDARSLVFGCADTVLDQASCGSCVRTRLAARARPLPARSIVSYDIS